jgi:ElaB/YqjD/DUF883 family membrane-anchored ribosome-binding protein
MTTTSTTRDSIPAAHRQGFESGSAKPSVAETFEDLRDRAGEMVRRAKDRTLLEEHKLEDYVGEHPLKSVVVAAGIGAGVGLLAGLLLARR